MKKNIEFKEQGFEIKALDCTAFLCNLTSSINVEHYDTESDDYRNEIKYFTWTLKRSFPELDDLELDLEGSAKAVNGKFVSFDLIYWQIDDSNDIVYSFDEKEFINELKSFLNN